MTYRDEDSDNPQESNFIHGARNFTPGENEITVAILCDEIELQRSRSEVPVSIRHSPQSVDTSHAARSDIVWQEKAAQSIRDIAPGCFVLLAPIPICSSNILIIEMFHAISLQVDVIYCRSKRITAPPIRIPLLMEMLIRSTSQGGPRGKGCLFCFCPFDWHLSTEAQGIVRRDQEPDPQTFPQSENANRKYVGIFNAGPCVAGVAALMISANPALATSEVIEILLSAMDKRMVLESRNVSTNDLTQDRTKMQCTQTTPYSLRAEVAVAEAVRRRS